MRILRIQFENLHSLRSGDIDLEHGALAEAGICAITGPTDAGKPTLLDALTLALYGRADTEPNPEHMINSDTGFCRAEVLFEVSGGRYIARWELRRAEGRLQPSKRTIVEAGSGAVLAEKLNEADRLIEELTGLDYERFRRSVALQQMEPGRLQTVEELEMPLTQAEAAESSATARVAQAAETLAKLLKGRTAEEALAESVKLDQRQTALVELRAAMEKRDAAAAEAARLAHEETELVEEVEAATREKEATLAEAQAQAEVLESTRTHLETQERIAGLDDQRARLVEGQSCPPGGALEPPLSITTVSPEIEEARRNLNAAKTANDTAAREARIAAEGLTRLEERLAGVRKRRGEMRWQQAADHEAFEKVARTVRIFTPEALQEAFAELEKTRAAQETLCKAIREAESSRHGADKARPNLAPSAGR